MRQQLGQRNTEEITIVTGKEKNSTEVQAREVLYEIVISKEWINQITRT